MQTFNERISEVATRKALSRKFQSKRPNLKFHFLSCTDQQRLIMALINEDPQVRALVAMKVDHALEDAYCDQVRMSEAIDDAIDIARFQLEDTIQRGRDLQAENSRYHHG